MLLNRIIKLISQPECSVCGKPGQAVCDGCWQKSVPLRKPACFWCNALTIGGKTCTRCARKTSLNGSTIPFRLDGLVKEHIHDLKYGGDRDAAQFLAQKLIPFLPNKTFDIISFVPSTGRSQRKRGYNQARLLAKHLARSARLPLQSTLLRIAHTDQIGLGRAQRLSSVENNFIAIGNVTGQSILLIDDVITTGATINECGHTLRIAGAKTIWCIAVAKK